MIYAVEQALDIVGEKLAARDLGADRKRLSEIEAQLDRAARLAVKTGGIEAATRIIGELDVERAKIERRLASDLPAPDMNTLRQVIEDRCQEMATAFEGHPRRAGRRCWRCSEAGGFRSVLTRSTASV